MIETVILYGFGSFFFDQNSAPRDVDILVLHEAIDRPSIDFAIHCKTTTKRLIPNADVTMLSYSEERELAFLDKCSGRLLGKVANSDHPDLQIEAIFRSHLRPLPIAVHGKHGR